MSKSHTNTADLYSATRKAFTSRFPNLKATRKNGTDMTDMFLVYLIEENIASGCNDAEKQEIANEVSNTIGENDIKSYIEDYNEANKLVNTEFELTVAI
jgi:hypothetical protein